MGVVSHRSAGGYGPEARRAGRWPRRIAASGALLLLLGALPARAGGDDFDEDGLSDRYERELLALLRPFLRVDRAESGITVSWEQFVAHSRLQLGTETLVPWGELTPERLRWHAVRHSRRGALHLDLDNDRKRATGWLGNYEVEGREELWQRLARIGDVGLYGRVTPIRLDAGYVRRNGRLDAWDGRPRQLIKVEYWLLWASSRGGGVAFELTDHEGDWERVHVFWDPAASQVHSVSFSHHGRYDWRAIPDVDRRRLREAATGTRVRLPASGLEFYAAGDVAWAAHPVVYVQRETHGMYARAHEDVVRGDARGGIDFLVATPPNIGSMRRPAPEHAIILEFPGRWGNASSGLRSWLPFSGARRGPLGPPYKRDFDDHYLDALMRPFFSPLPLRALSPENARSGRR